MLNLSAYRNYGVLALRLALGVVFIMHGYQKLFLLGLNGVSQYFSSLGIPAPGFFALIVSLVEFLGGLAILLGFFARYFSLLIMIDMLVAFLIVHVKNGFFLPGGFEFVFTLFFGALAIFLLGTKRWALDKALFNREF